MRAGASPLPPARPRAAERSLFAKPRAAFDGDSCATCHPPSSFFRDGRTHRLGTGQPPSPHAIDDGFDTPTLLGTAETAPYFHDGRFATLADVVAWFDRSFALDLGADGDADLTAYLAAVGASDRTADDRPPAQVMIDSFVYLELLLDGEDARRSRHLDRRARSQPRRARRATPRRRRSRPRSPARARSWRRCSRARRPARRSRRCVPRSRRFAAISSASPPTGRARQRRRRERSLTRARASAGGWRTIDQDGNNGLKPCVV